MIPMREYNMTSEKQITQYHGTFLNELEGQIETLMQKMQINLLSSFDDFDRCHTQTINYLNALKQMEYYWALNNEALDNPKNKPQGLDEQERILKDKATSIENLNRIQQIQVGLK